MAVDTGSGAAIGVVLDGYSKYSDLGTSAFKSALNLVSALPNIQVPNIPVDVNFPDPGPVPSAFTLPSAPQAPNLAFTAPGTPVPPALTLPSIPSVPDAPVFNGAPPTLRDFPAPDPLNAVVPEFTDTITPPTLPDKPVLVIPDAPTLRSYNLPAVPNVSLPTFTATLATFNITPPDSHFNFVEAGYTSANLPVIQARINEMLAGGTGLPAIIEQAMFDRARAREDQTAQKAVQEANEDWSARGFKLPGGELMARVRGVRQDNQDKANALQRELTIQVHNVAIENLRFSVTQGIALEGILLGHYDAVQQRAFEVQKYALDAAINLFNANIALYNVRLGEFQARAQVYRDLIGAEAQKLELYKAQLDGQRLIGELNQQDVQVYTARIQALNQLAELYRTEVSAVEAQVSIDRLSVDIFRARVDAYAQQVNAKRSEFEAWGEEIRGETAKVTAYSTEASAYESLVRAYSSKVEAGLAQPRLAADLQRLTLDQFNGRIAAYNAEVNAQAQTITAGATVFRGQADIYSAQANAETSRFGALSKQFEMALESGKANAQIVIEQARLAITEVQTAAQLYVEAMKGAASTAAQLAASSISAVNLGAKIGEDYSENVNTSYNLSGTAPSPPAA